MRSNENIMKYTGVTTKQHHQKQTKQIHDLWLKRNIMEDYYLNQELNMKINTNQGYDLSLIHIYT